MLKYDFNNIDYDNFIKTFLTVLDKHAPIKKKYLRANHANFVTKQLRKAIMKRSKLRNDFLKDRNDASQSAYRKQRNLCVTLLRKAKKQYFSNLEPKLITDNKKFWKSVKPLLSDNITVKEIINLTESGEVLSSDTDITDTFNDYFSNVAQNLNIPRENSILNTDLCINAVLKRSENRDLIAYFILHNFNNALSCSEYPASLKICRYDTNLQKG